MTIVATTVSDQYFLLLRPFPWMLLVVLIQTLQMAVGIINLLSETPMTIQTFQQTSD